MRVNLGCGERYVEGWLNVDHGCPHRKDADVDLSLPLPWEPGTIERVYCGHLLEHLPRAACVPLLSRLATASVPGAQIMVVGPDVVKAKAMIKAGTFDFRWHQLDSIEHGAGRWEGDSHEWECRSDVVVEMLVEAGWREVTDVGIANVPPEWPVADREPAWQLAVSAVAP